MLVWQDWPSSFFGNEGRMTDKEPSATEKQEIERQMKEMIQQHSSFPASSCLWSSTKVADMRV